MKKIVIFCASMVVLAGCHSDFAPSPVIGVNQSGKQNQIIHFTDAQATGLSVKIVSIEDSRCPSDALCIVAGEVKVQFSVDGNSISLKKGESAKFTFKGHIYQPQLIDVTPYPSSTNTHEDKTAVFQVIP